MQVLIPSGTGHYLTAGVRGISNPFKGAPFLFTQTAYNNSKEALNVVMALVGYRLNMEPGSDQYFYLEPKLGPSFSQRFEWVGANFAPALGYKGKVIDLAVQVDAGMGNRLLFTGKKTYIIPGVSVGVTF